MIDRPSAVELIIGYPNPHESFLTSGEVERINDGIDELKTEAAGHGIGIFDSSDPKPVAMRLLRWASGL